MPNEIDTVNRFMVAAAGRDEIVFPFGAVPRRLSKADALNLAAWLVAIADHDDQFQTLLTAVRNT